MDKILCSNCKKELEENERPCSLCGCPNRIYSMNLTVKMKMRTSLNWKHKRRGFKRPIVEGVSRDKISRDPKLEGQEVHEEYVIDRIKKWWCQSIQDVKTKEIIHQEDKSLDQK